jgi:WD repeat-containing protein 92
MMNKLLVTTLESKIHVFDVRTQNDDHGGFAYCTEKAHDSTVWIGRHLPQNREVFMTCGGSGSMYLWK